MTDLAEVLGEARDLGFVGPGRVERHLDHATAFASAVEQVLEGSARRSPPSTVVDLGSGAGVPGLTMARRWPGSSVDLLESSARRASFLTGALERLGLPGRAAVVADRAELVGRMPDRRGHYEVAVARSFGPPGVTAECASPLLEAGGWLVVSEPPGSDLDEGRWSPVGLRGLGMSPAVPITAGGYHFVGIRQTGECPERFPRRVGVPAKRPVF